MCDFIKIRMNFLSHFYFERYATQPERVLGGILPDLLKNADKKYMFHPNRFETILLDHPQYKPIYEGWNRHLEVDRIFHNTPFFFDHTHRLRIKIQDSLSGLPVRPSFLAHVALELILDHLLLKHQVINVDRFYEDLEKVHPDTIIKFLKIVGLEDTTKFMSYYERFVNSKYTYEYADITRISHALFNIAKRIWDFEPVAGHHLKLTEELIMYTDKQLTDYKSIYFEIQDRLSLAE